MQLSFRQANLDDEAELEQIGRILVADDLLTYGGAEGRTPETTRIEISGNKYWEIRPHVALDAAGDVVAMTKMYLPQAENRDQVMVEMYVDPARRGQGIGGRFLDHLVPHIRETGRPVVVGWPVLPPDEDDAPGARLCTRLGLTLRSVAAIRACPLPIPDEVAAGLQSEVDGKLGDYRIELWTGRIPDEHVEAFCALHRQLDADDPREDYEDELSDFTPERLRIAEERMFASGKARLLAVAFAPEGAIVGMSEVVYSTVPGTSLGHQEDTVVMPGHRGHRLGLGLKLATHRRAREVAPHLDVLVTYNSHINDQMIGINERLGYRLIAREGAFQGRLDG